jgi:hypothetical protein
MILLAAGSAGALTALTNDVRYLLPQLGGTTRTFKDRHR